MGESENIHFRQRQTVDRVTLRTLELSRSEFIDMLADKIIDLRQHHFVCGTQTAYLKQLKDNLPLEECILLCDFAEKYARSSKIKFSHFIGHLYKIAYI